MALARRPSWLLEAEQVDLAVYAAVARTPTPSLDRVMRSLTSAADRSRLWMVVAGALSIAGGANGRRAARIGLAAVGATSVAVNVVIKPLARRRRPDRDLHSVPLVRHVAMPVSRSFPSGHAAAAAAFASSVGHIPLHRLATAVAYSRVHSGVHFPGDALIGAIIGIVGAHVTAHAVASRSRTST
jgi:membrane-associated phospholipid phosphatase